jgi:predicted ATPase/DNA-binding CsgD family transcriptional regulator
MTVVSHKSVISPVLVGRQEYVDALHALLQQSMQGHGQLALLMGEAGIGKSRLVAEVKRIAAGDGFWIVEGQCVEPDRVFPYAPLLEILHTLVADPAAATVIGRLGAAAATLARFFPELEWPAAAPQSAYEAEQEKRLLHYGLTRYLLALAGERPLLLAVEDLHWSDDATLDFLLYLIRHLADQRIFLLLTYRGDEAGAGLARFVAAVARQRLATELTLAPLNKAQVDEMMRAIFELKRPVRGEFLQAVSDLTEGNPFFIEEVLKSLLAVGDIYRTESEWDRRPLAELRIPRTVSDAVQRRAANLSTPARQLLALAAVAGRRFDVALLQAVTEQDDEVVLAALKELVAAQLIVEAGTDEFTFRHALTQQALYSSLLARERQTMHRALAQRLVHGYGDRVEANIAELAYHYHAAGAWEEAILYTQRAGDRAQQLYMAQAAVTQYSRALEAASHLPSASISDVDLASLYRARGLAHDMLGSFEEAQRDLLEGLALARAHASQPEAWQMEWQLLIDLGFLWASRDYARTGDYYEEALALAQRLEEPRVLARTYNRMGNLQLNRGRIEDAIQAYRQAYKVFEKLQDRHGLAETLDLMGMASGQMGDPHCITYYEEAAAIFRELDDHVSLVSVLAELGPFRNYFGRIEEAESNARRAAVEFSEALEVAQRTGNLSGEAFLLSEYAQVLAWRGDYALAFEYCRRSLALAQEIDHRQWSCAALQTLGGFYLDLMEYAMARPLLEQALELAQEVGSQIYAQVASALLALLYLEAGEGEKAEPALARTKSSAPVSYHDHLGWVARLRLALWRNSPEQALRLFQECHPMFSSADKGNWIALSLRQARGEALAALDDPQAETALREVRNTAQRTGTRSLLWRVCVVLGSYLRERKRNEEAEREFRLARSLIEQLAAGIEEEEVRENFRRRGLAMIPVLAAPTPRQAAKRAYDGLTPAEQQVAALVAQGKSNREIAAAQVVSIKTVEAHVSHILGKLGFSSRAQIAAWAVHKGLLVGKGDA